MTKPKFQNPRTKVQLVRPKSISLNTTIPEAVAYTLGLKVGDSIEWIRVQEGHDSFVKVRKVQ